MKSYRELLTQRVQLDADIAAAAALERRAAVKHIREIMAEFRITVAELGGPRGRKPGMRRPLAAPKYCDPATGKTWNGRGRTPRWLVGQDRELYRLVKTDSANGT
jgi:DNA-binding protein H-NS